jgi:hypothetical protein
MPLLTPDSPGLSWVLDYLRALRAGRLRPYSFVERKARAATRDESWGPTGAQLRELAAASYGSEHLPALFDVLCARLRGARGAGWRKAYKSLVVLEWLATRGSPAAAQRAHGLRYLLDELRTFQYVDPDTGVDHGACGAVAPLCRCVWASERTKRKRVLGARRLMRARRVCAGLNVRHRAAAVLALLSDGEHLSELREAQAKTYWRAHAHTHTHARGHRKKTAHTRTRTRKKTLCAFALRGSRASMLPLAGRCPPATPRRAPRWTTRAARAPPAAAAAVPTATATATTAPRARARSRRRRSNNTRHAAAALQTGAPLAEPAAAHSRHRHHRHSHPHPHPPPLRRACTATPKAFPRRTRSAPAPRWRSSRACPATGTRTHTHPRTHASQHILLTHLLPLFSLFSSGLVPIAGSLRPRGPACGAACSCASAARACTAAWGCTSQQCAQRRSTPFRRYKWLRWRPWAAMTWQTRTGRARCRAGSHGRPWSKWRCAERG